MSETKQGVRKERIIALDLLRGLFLCVIVTTHIAWAPSLFSVIGGRGQLFASAAEGFFAISGILVGFIYGPRILSATRKMALKMWRRAGVLYILAVGFTFFYTAWAVLQPDTPKYETIYTRGEFRFLIDTFTLRYAFGWADFLTRYAAFMLAAPFVVWLIAKRKAWIVALGSFLIWFFLRETDRFLPFASWQLVFMFGIIIGYYLPQIESKFTSLTYKTRRTILVPLWTIGIVSFAASIMWILVIPYLAEHYRYFAEMPIIQSLNLLLSQIMPYFNKDHLDPARIAVGVVWFAALLTFFRVYEEPINRLTRGVLDTMGKNSLFVYGLHAFILFFIDMYFRPPSQQSVLANTLVTGIVLLIIYLLTRHRGIFARIRRKLLPSFSKEVIP